MSRIARFAAYAAAFEKCYENDDWSLLEPYFTEDAVYDAALDPPIGARLEGRDAILAYFEDGREPLRSALREPRARAARRPEGRQATRSGSAAAPPIGPRAFLPSCWSWRRP